MEVHKDLCVEMLTTGPFAENCYLVWDSASHRAIVVDPGSEADRILHVIRNSDLDVLQILATHAHIDHVGAVALLKRTLGVPFAIHPDELEWLANLPVQAKLFGAEIEENIEIPEVDRSLSDLDEIRVGSLRGRVLLTPGHSPGGCSLYFEDEGVLFAGDALFAGSIGRTDLPGGNLSRLLRAIHARILTLPDHVVVYSGHGPATTIAKERSENPFLQAPAPNDAP